LQAIISAKSICKPNLLFTGWSQWSAALSCYITVINLLSNYNKKNIRFVWLPCHIGIKGHELADKLANSATANSHVKVDVGLELLEAYNLVDSYIINKWQQSWAYLPHLIIEQ